MHDDRGRWLAQKKPTIATDLIQLALEQLPETVPIFFAIGEREAFVEEVQFAVIEILRRQEKEYCMGVVFERVSRTRWQFALEWAVASVVTVVVDEYLRDTPVPKRR